MKLYILTEEQLKVLTNALTDIKNWDEDLEDEWDDCGYRAIDALNKFSQFTPIELPSDEEIDEQANSHFTIHFNKNGEPMTHIVGHQNPHGFNKFKKTFIKGYKAALEHIRNQIK